MNGNSNRYDGEGLELFFGCVIAIFTIIFFIGAVYSMLNLFGLVR